MQTSLIIGGIILISLLVFGIYSWLAIRHAARFRYLSARTVSLTVIFVSLSALIIAFCLFSFGMMLISAP
ncbi:MAG: hypothetical protein WC846_02590 [Candidatus Gracilibacteria bacterium]